MYAPPGRANGGGGRWRGVLAWLGTRPHGNRGGAHRPRATKAAAAANPWFSHPAVLAAALLLVLAGCVWSGNRYFTRKARSGAAIAEPPLNLQLDLQQHAADEMLLRQIVDECATRQDTTLFLSPERELVVDKALDLTHCPPLDIMLRGAERGVGMCTDVALYVMHAGGRVIPMPADVAAYDAACGPRTARLFLETLYQEFLSAQRGVLHMQLVNAEHFWSADAAVHARMNVFLCKTYMCVDLLHRHVADKGGWAQVWYMSHTSSDASVGVSGDVLAGVRASLSLGRPAPQQQQQQQQQPQQQQQGFAIHVKGKSGLKQTRTLLDCWARHTDWPPLVVVGQVGDADASLAARSAPNIVFLPPLGGGGAPAPEGSSGSGSSGSSSLRLLDASRLRDMQAAAWLHLCPSVREGFGHYLNEARAVGALVVTTDHPPMNELVMHGVTGLLVPTDHTKSEPGTELGTLTHINGHVSVDGLCAVIERGLAQPQEQTAAMRGAAQAAFRTDKAAFLHRMRQLKAHLEARARKAAAAAAGRSKLQPGG